MPSACRWQPRDSRTNNFLPDLALPGAYGRHPAQARLLGRPPGTLTHHTKNLGERYPFSQYGGAGHVGQRAAPERSWSRAVDHVARGGARWRPRGRGRNSAGTPPEPPGQSLLAGHAPRPLRAQRRGGVSLVTFHPSMAAPVGPVKFWRPGKALGETLGRCGGLTLVLAPQPAPWGLWTCSQA